MQTGVVGNPLEMLKIRETGFFRFPIFHITCIIRKLYHQKIRSPPSSFSSSETISFEFCSRNRFHHGCTSLCGFFSFADAMAKQPLCILLWLKKHLFNGPRSKISADGFIVNACRLFAAFFVAEPRNICLARYKALLCQHCRTI